MPSSEIETLVIRCRTQR